MTACQQLLVLAVVAALLVPASETISLDVRPAGPSGSEGQAALAAEDESATVPTGAVDPEVTEHSLTAQPGARVSGSSLRATAKRVAGGQQITSDALPADGYAAVGLTWAAGSKIAHDDIEVSVRTLTQDSWSAWQQLEYHDEHGPETGSTEAAAGVRPGTDAMFVGEVDRVQLRVVTAGRAPADLRLAVIDPGEAKQTAQQGPAIDVAAQEAAPRPDGRVAARVAPSAAKPRIFSRKQWGANEKLRDKKSLSYGEIHGGFVHHTVNGNGYRKGEVPGIIRSIYAYHTKSRGWSDIGYNFLVDKFGRIWEGRAGGVNRPVIGAHTLGYNDVAFAGSAIGNFESRKPRAAMVRAFSRLMAWKLGLHGVNPQSKVRLHGKRFRAISGHRDAGSTACPGKHLYQRLPGIRKRAGRIQKGSRGRELESNLAKGPRPDLVLRRQSDGRVILLPIVKKNGRIRTGKAVNTGRSMPRAISIWNAGDWDRDGHSDLMARGPGGKILLYRGNGTGKFRKGRVIAKGFARHKLLTAVGDFTGDGYPDLIGKPKGGNLKIYPGRGLKGVRKGWRAAGKVKAGRQQIAIGRWNRGAAPDTFIRTKRKLWAYYGNGPGGFTGRKRLNVNIRAYNWFVGVSDVNLKSRQADVIARERGTGRLFLLQGRTNGTFKSRVSLGRRVKGDFRVVN